MFYRKWSDLSAFLFLFFCTRVENVCATLLAETVV